MSLKGQKWHKKERPYSAKKKGIVKDLKVIGGCSGNLQGIANLVKGRTVDEVIERLNGIKCGFKPTSCPDQIAKALEQYKKQA